LEISGPYKEEVSAEAVLSTRPVNLVTSLTEILPPSDMYMEHVGTNLLPVRIDRQGDEEGKLSKVSANNY